MAELLVLIADALAGKLGEDVEGYSEKSWQVRFNNGLLAVGKFAGRRRRDTRLRR